MNKAFRILWSHTRQAFVVADEYASTGGKRSGTRLLLAGAGAVLLAASPGAVLAANLCTSLNNTISAPSSGDDCSLTSSASVSILGTGVLIATGNAISAAGDFESISNNGSIQGSDYGIFLNASGRLIDNSGLIRGGTSGIAIQSGSRVESLNNSGTIEGLSAAAIYMDGYAGINEIRNTGTIRGSTFGIHLGYTGKMDRIVNQAGGTIRGDDVGIQLGSNAEIYDSITNSGTIQGDRFSIFDSNYSTRLDSLFIEGNDTARLLGDVVAENTNVLVKSGAVFSSTNAFEVESFTIERNATLNMGTGISSSGDLADGFTVSDGFTNNGTLALASGVTGSIHGDYTQSTSGALKIGVDDNTTFGKLVVDRTAELASNAKIAVNVSSPNYNFSVDSLQDVLSAGTLNSDGSFAVSDNSLLFDFGAVKDGNTVDLTISATERPGNGLIEGIVTDLGNTPAVGAAKVLDQAIGNDPESELAGHFVGLTSEQEVSDAVTQTLPTVAGNTSNAIGNTLSGINRVVQARQAGNSGLSSGDAVADDNLWIKTFGAWADQDSRDGISGFDANTQGLAIGADAALDAHTRLGLAFAYAQTNLNGDSAIAPQSADIDTFQLIGYGSYALTADTELNVQLDGGQNRTSSKRQMPFADASAKADYDGYNVHAGIGIGHSLRLNEQLTFIPSARADYTWIGSESYHEKGAGALDLDVDSNDAEELLLSVDGKLDYRITEATVISANLGAGYDLIDEDSAITSTYAGAPGAAFKTPGMDLEPWLARAGLGLSHTLAGGTEVSLRYDAEARSDFTNQGASVKARWAF
ncbi:outer membrane autotransporter barrel domain-containing protein [Aquipseudomonas alcaligenes]|uniref:autotransporter domain-containing protein n=1 Tax=Aquipseudomonas alcaligenes TaxID=43263 RepID=UPI000954D434|nr:autotransporter domain-containing protein [Pseudomonas alcaligenes]SIR90733.1 outer membrane autotransporter barrel domain-containing protein [Pseudomonas alcaligenes]